MPFGGGAEDVTDLLKGVMKDEDVVGHIRRDPQQTIAMNRL